MNTIQLDYRVRAQAADHTRVDGLTEELERERAVRSERTDYCLLVVAAVVVAAVLLLSLTVSGCLWLSLPLGVTASHYLSLSLGVSGCHCL